MNSRPVLVALQNRATNRNPAKLWVHFLLPCTADASCQQTRRRRRQEALLSWTARSRIGTRPAPALGSRAVSQADVNRFRRSNNPERNQRKETPTHLRTEDMQISCTCSVCKTSTEATWMQVRILDKSLISPVKLPFAGGWQVEEKLLLQQKLHQVLLMRNSR